jgi:hypothetical protein
LTLSIASSSHRPNAIGVEYSVSVVVAYADLAKESTLADA